MDEIPLLSKLAVITVSGYISRYWGAFDGTNGAFPSIKAWNNGSFDYCDLGSAHRDLT